MWCPLNTLFFQITDFGLATLKSEAAHTIDQQCGTIKYMPPEALENQMCKPTLKRDIYSYAILLHVLISGEELYEGDNIIKVINPR